MLLGFSEGAATVGAFLWQLANNPGGTAQKMGNTLAYDLSAAVLFECTNSSVSRNWGDREITDTMKTFKGLDYLPDTLSQAGVKIRLLDVWNNASIVHGSPAKGWGGFTFSYDSRAVPQNLSLLGIFIRVINTNSYHGNILRNQDVLTTMHDTFYP
jgi:hypothetical protein